ncbi:MAG: hypothetical protein Q9M19_01255 [Mariprofundaceae bacterium]|nr:hypothetical protein [Mariprofundaceae bacterium]
MIVIATIIVFVLGFIVGRKDCDVCMVYFFQGSDKPLMVVASSEDFERGYSCHRGRRYELPFCLKNKAKG